ncbi:MAG: aspartate kinase [Clostridia bacterium]|nr:aspartate kinase [Clostridia bacterium]
MSVKVLKFGGSSLADAGQIQKVASIIRNDEACRYVVPSAPGKRFSGDEKITDLLYGCYEIAKANGDFSDIFEKIKERYRQIIAGLSLQFNLEEEFERIKVSILHHAGRDYIASRGEYLNGLILAEYLGFSFLDAANGVFFREDGTFDAEHTDEVLKDLLSSGKKTVIPGFYGSMPNGTIKTFSRGGSDITGAIVARAVAADVYENWTDVSGFMMADPRIVKNPKPISTITYRELRELSYMGATVLHDESIFPVRHAGIPINIRNTNDPAAKGTWIVASARDLPSDSVITGVAGRKGMSIVSLEKDMMNAELGFGRRGLEVVEDLGISFEHLPSGVDTMSIVMATSSLEGKRDRLLEGICRSVQPDTISIDDGFALIAVVGRGMVAAKGTAQRIFTSVADAGVNIKMIDQGSSELNIIIGVRESDYEKAIKAIYGEFGQ